MQMRSIALIGLAALLAGCSYKSIAYVPFGHRTPVPERPSAAPDAGTHHIYVANSSANTITVYKSTATGNMAPVRRIRGANTGLSDPQYVALDAAGDLYVTNYAVNSVTEYAPTASGNAAPLATITGGVTQLSLPEGIAVDTAGKIYVANNGGGGGAYITVYPKGAHNGQSPSATIYDSIGLESIAGLAVHGTTIYASVTDFEFNEEINEYPTNSDGTVTAFPQIGGLNAPTGVAVEGDAKVVVVDGDSVKVFAATANGAPPPLQTIAGSATLLNGPTGVCTGASTIFVVDSATPALTSYAVHLSANKAPSTDVTGSLSQLASPVGTAFQP